MPRSRKIVATLDAETDPFRHGTDIQPFIWGFRSDVDGQLFFDDIQDFLSWLEMSGREYVIYAHNGGKFDYFWLLPFIEEETSLLYINGRLAKFTIGLAEFRDSYCIIPAKLAAYKKDDIDYSKFLKENRKQHMDEIRKYLAADCQYLLELVKQFRADYGNGITLAGTAMKVWEEMSHKKAPSSGGIFYDTFRPFYSGGRVQCFHKGILPPGLFHVIDIHSAYPYAMRHDHPISTEWMPMQPSIDDGVCPQWFYSITATARGCFPHRDGGKLSFPDDGVERDYHVTGWELINGLDLGLCDLVRVNAVYGFGGVVNFTPYVNKFYALKESSEKGSAQYLFAKILLNSLYGKYGSNPNEYDEYQCIPLAMASHVCELMGEEWGIRRILSKDKCLISGPIDDEGKRFYNVATAASITGFVRAYLLKQMHAIRQSGGTVFYCDTDSIVYTGDVDACINMGDEVGQWEKEFTGDKGGIAGRKLYAFHNAAKCKPDKEWKTACKGVRLNASEIMRVCAGETVTYQREAPSFNMITGAKSYITRKVQLT